MAQVFFNKAFGIASLSGRIGDLIFYNRNGKTFVRKAPKSNGDPRAILETSSSHSRAIHESDDVFNPQAL